MNSSAVEESLKSFTLTGYDEGNNKKWEMEGENAAISTDNIDLTNVKANIYEKSQVIDIKADKGFINKANQKVSLRKNVIVKDSQGGVLYTDILNWDQKKDVIWTDAYLKLVKNGNEVVGTGGEVDTKLTQAVIKKDVKLKAIPQTIITASGPLEVDYSKNIAVFNKDVHVVDRKGELFCDTMVVYFDPQKKSIIKADAKGNVKLKRGNSYTYSQEAIYDVKEGKVTLLGRPKLEIYPE